MGPNWPFVKLNSLTLPLLTIISTRLVFPTNVLSLWVLASSQYVLLRLSKEEEALNSLANLALDSLDLLDVGKVGKVGKQATQATAK